MDEQKTFRSEPCGENCRHLVHRMVRYLADIHIRRDDYPIARMDNLLGHFRQAEDASRRIYKLEQLRASYRKKFVAERNKERLENVVDYLLGSPITSIGAAQKGLKLDSYRTAQRYIEKLQSFGILREVTGKGRNRVYFADELLKVIEGRI